ncbi:hypothetical protein BDN72DRAFT_841540 [Pluteus cervinus]|uniref:Uncharacterized protein n=1 Tax=Pluteus cervinus TaxID=181527 RepID=A0ACD3ATL6_9AGAR|nr:hypothetical protein BDN72DRAFT_841540 [Pluteus cervinus]
MDAIAPSLKTNKDALDQARTKIDKNILLLEDQLRALKSERNTLAPVNFLPPDVLARIFRHLRDRWWIEAGYVPQRVKNALVKWIWVTHVSKTWREIALGPGQPDLWTVIPTQNIPCYTAFLARSRQAGLFVEIDNKSWTWKVGPVLEQYRRIRQFKHKGNVSDDVRGYLGFPAPQLESFSFHPESAYSPNLPDNLFANSTPRLRHVYIQDCAFNWNLGIFHNNLVTLSIVTPISTTTIKVVVDLLATMPKLETLALHHVLQKDEQGRVNKTAARAVDLPFLTKLEIHTDTFRQLLSLLSRFTVSGQAEMNLHYKAASDTPFFDAFSVIQRSRKETSFNDIQAVQLSQDSFTAYTQDRPTGTPVFSLHCEPKVVEPAGIGKWLPKALELFSDNLESFSAIDVPITEKMWVRLEKPLWRVGHIKTVGSPGTALIAFLTNDYDNNCPQNARDEGEDGDGHCCDMAGGYKEEDWEDIAYENVASLEMTKMVYPDEEEHERVLYMFYHRNKFERGFSTVSFTACPNLSRDQAYELGLHVDKVHFEEAENDDEEEWYGHACV